MRFLICTLFGFMALFYFNAFSAEDTEQQLTGTFHSAVGKAEAYLDIDGQSVTDRIILTGDVLKDIPDGTRIWIKGKIVTLLVGLPYKEGQATIPHWRITFAATECNKISKPFELPTDKTDNASKAVDKQQQDSAASNKKAQQVAEPDRKHVAQGRQ